RAPRPQAIQIREALLAWLQSSMLESTALYMSWARLRTGKRRDAVDEDCPEATSVIVEEGEPVESSST
nr:hypothetical protein [Tanacetum cinerariifolium]